MTSRKLFFDYLKNQLKNKFWLLLFVFFAYFSFISLPANYMIYETASKGVMNYFLISSYFVTVLVAIFNGFSLFSYLFSKNEIIFYHSLPLKRGKIFFEKQLVGLLSFFGAFLINYLFIYTVSIASVIDLMPGQMISILIKNLITYLIINNAVIFAIVISNSFLVASFNAMVVFLLPMLMFFTIESYESKYNLYNMVAYLFDFKRLSPIFLSYMLHNPNEWVLNVYQHHILSIILFAFVTMGVNLLLFQYRKSEIGDLGRVYNIINQVLQVGTQVFLSLFVAIAIDSNVFLMYLILSIITMYCIIELLKTFDVKSILYNKWNLITTLALALLFIGCFELNLVNIKFEIPDKNEISETELHINGFDEVNFMHSVFQSIPRHYERRDGYDRERTDLDINEYYNDNADLKYAFIKDVVEAGVLRDRRSDRAEEIESDKTNLGTRFTLNNGKSILVHYRIKKSELYRIYKKYFNEENIKKVHQYDGIQRLNTLESVSFEIADDLDYEYKEIRGARVKENMEELLQTYLKEYLKYYADPKFDAYIEEKVTYETQGFTEVETVSVTKTSIEHQRRFFDLYAYEDPMRTNEDEYGRYFAYRSIFKVRFFLDERFSETIAVLNRMRK